MTAAAGAPIATIDFRVEYSRFDHDYACTILHEDGHEEPIGSAKTQAAGVAKCRDYILRYYQDNSTPEPPNGAGMRMAEPCFEETGAPDQETLREWAKEDAVPDLCENDGTPATVIVTEMGLQYTLCSACFYACFRDNEQRITAWEVTEWLAPDAPPVAGDDPQCDNCEGKGGCAECDPYATPPATVEEAFQLAVALSTTPLPDEGRHQHTPTQTIECTICETVQRCIWDGVVWLCEDRAACNGRMVASVKVLSGYCGSCYGTHPTWQCPQIGALLMAEETDEYRAFIVADEAWSAELERLFGGKAGDIRYTAEGRTGPTLTPLYAEFRRACEAWHAKQEGTRRPLPSRSVLPARTAAGCPTGPIVGWVE